MDTKKLRELAEAATPDGEYGPYTNRHMQVSVPLEEFIALLDEHDSLRAEVERLGKLRDIIERLAQFNEEEAKAWILSEYGARKAGAAVALRSVLREFDSIGKDGGNE